jgi:hypothetical protein
MLQDEGLRQAIALIKAGNKSEALPILKNILKTDRNNELAWLWLSACADKLEDKRFCFHEALRINPNNEQAKKALEQIEPQLTPQTIPEIKKRIPEDKRSETEIKQPWIKRYIPLWILLGLVMICLCLSGIYLTTFIRTTPTVVEIPKEGVTAVEGTLTAQPVTNTPAPLSTLRPSSTPMPSITPMPSMTHGLPPAASNSNVTMAKFNQIQAGMSYQQVVNIIGKEGEEMSRVELAGYITVMYMWQNTDGSNMNAMFQNGGLISKTQFGLK